MKKRKVLVECKTDPNAPPITITKTRTTKPAIFVTKINMDYILGKGNGSIKINTGIS